MSRVQRRRSGGVAKWLSWNISKPFTDGVIAHVSVKVNKTSTGRPKESAMR
jgi:hypothetical protein